MRKILLKAIKKRLFAFAVTTFSLIVFSAPIVRAIARGYTTSDTGLQTGMVVALSTNSSSTNQVERASQDNSQEVVGVVTTIDSSLVSVASANSKVLVESEGEVDAYVSDINGAPKKGDLLAASPFKGIMMKASSNPEAILGIADSDFPSDNAESYSIDDNGTPKSTQIAKIKVNLNHQGANNVPIAPDSVLARLGRAIVGHDVGEVRVVIALVIFIIVLIAEGSILYGAISSAITALGRNPLAKKVIRQELVRVVVIALLVLCFGLGTIYAVLWI